MIKQDDAISIFSQIYNYSAAVLQAVFVFVLSFDVSDWGIIAGILFGAISTYVTVWSKRKLVKIAERSGNVEL